MDVREALAYALFRWDDTTDTDRTDQHYLEAAGLAITHAGADVDNLNEMMDAVSIWDAAAGPIEDRRRDDYLELADLLMATPSTAAA